MLTFKDILKECSPEEIIKYLDTDSVDEYKEVYAKLMDLEPVDTGCVFVGIDYTGCGKTENEVAAYNAEELKEALGSSSKLASVSFEEVANLSGEEAGKLAGVTVLPVAVMYECCPWNEVLGFKVDRENVDSYGVVPFVGDVLFKMTFFSFSEEEIAEIREVIKDTMSLVDETRKMDEEEREKNIFSAERSAAYFSFQDNRPEEEKMEDMYEAARGTVRNLIREYETVKNVVGI